MSGLESPFRGNVPRRYSMTLATSSLSGSALASLTSRSVRAPFPNHCSCHPDPYRCRRGDWCRRHPPPRRRSTRQDRCPQASGWCHAGTRADWRVHPNRHPSRHRPQRVQGIRDLPVIGHAVIVSVRLGRIRVGHPWVVGRAIIIEAAFRNSPTACHHRYPRGRVRTAG